MQQRVGSPLVLAFSPIPEVETTVAASRPAARPVSMMANEEGLPKNVHLLTLALLPESRVLLRLAHLYQVHLQLCGSMRSACAACTVA